MSKVRRNEDRDLRVVADFEVDGRRPMGRPRMRWLEVVKKDIRRLGLQKEMAMNRSFWRTAVHAVDPACRVGLSTVKEK